MQKITNTLQGLRATPKANKRFKEWFANTNNHDCNMNLKQFLNADSMTQKGVFELFFASLNYGIFVRDTGYDVYILNPSLTSNEDKNATFIYDSIITDELGVDYYYIRNWNNKKPDYWKATSLAYFNMMAIIETMKLINVS